jgi:hypothetical protein
MLYTDVQTRQVFPATLPFGKRERFAAQQNLAKLISRLTIQLETSSLRVCFPLLPRELARNLLHGRQFRPSQPYS